MSKVRIYDLAKELKLESKKILEDARRMGVDVSVPSNTLEDADRGQNPRDVLSKERAGPGYT